MTAELPLLPATSRESLLADAAALDDSVDGFVLTDNQYGQPHMAPAYAAAILLQEGLSPVLQISSRNRNRIALIGELLGASAIGIDTLVLVRGAILPEGYEPRPGAVMDTDAKDLIATARLMNESASRGPGDALLIGTSATVHEPNPQRQPVELQAKIAAGAQLVITQVCLSTDVLSRYMRFLVDHKLLQQISVIVTIAHVGSAEIAQWLRENRHGTIIPDEWMPEPGRDGDEDSQAVAATAALMKSIADVPGVSGVNFAAAGDLHKIPGIVAAFRALA